MAVTLSSARKRTKSSTSSKAKLRPIGSALSPGDLPGLFACPSLLPPRGTRSGPGCTYHFHLVCGIHVGNTVEEIPWRVFRMGIEPTLSTKVADKGQDWRTDVGASDSSRSTDLARAREPGRGREANTPEQIPPRGWKDILWRVLWSISENRILSTSGSVAFFALLESSAICAKNGSSAACAASRQARTICAWS